MNMIPSPQDVADEKETGRIEAFSDGVMSIAITLLAFDLRVPTAEAIAQFGLVGATLRNWPMYLAFLAGFFSILVMWVNHHRLFMCIRRTDDTLMLLNGLLLLGISVVPFSTKFVAEFLQHPEAATAVIFYCLWGVVVAILFNLLWRYASHHNRLFSAKTDQSLVAFITQQYSFGPALYLIAMGIALISPALSLLICLGLAIFFALPNKTYRKLADSAK
jgi:uncharacterized membrane protein